MGLSEGHMILARGLVTSNPEESVDYDLFCFPLYLFL